MTTTNFVDQVTPIVATWLNDVDASTYQGQLDSGATNASIDKYAPSGTGAVTTTVQAKLRESVSPKDFGAVGDGATNDAAAMLLAAFGKEAVDRLANWRAQRAGQPAPHGVEILDAVATCAGGALAALPLFILEFT